MADSLRESCPEFNIYGYEMNTACKLLKVVFGLSVAGAVATWISLVVDIIIWRQRKPQLNTSGRGAYQDISTVTEFQTPKPSTTTTRKPAKGFGYLLGRHVGQLLSRREKRSPTRMPLESAEQMLVPMQHERVEAIELSQMQENNDYKPRHSNDPVFDSSRQLSATENIQTAYRGHINGNDQLGYDLGDGRFERRGG